MRMLEAILVFWRPISVPDELDPIVDETRTQTQHPSAWWEHFAHEADMGVRGLGPSLAEAFEQGALAMTAIITDPAGVQAQECVVIECSARDPELLFAEWLNSLVYEMATRHMLFCKFSVTIDGPRLRAEAWGERVDASRHHPAVEIKGATYTALRVAHEDSRWLAQTVVDL